VQAEQRRHQQHAAVTAFAKRSRFAAARGVLDIGGMDDGVQQRNLMIGTAKLSDALRMPPSVHTAMFAQCCGDRQRVSGRRLLNRAHVP